MVAALLSLERFKFIRDDQARKRQRAAAEVEARVPAGLHDAWESASKPPLRL